MWTRLDVISSWSELSWSTERSGDYLCLNPDFSIDDGDPSPLFNATLVLKPCATWLDTQQRWQRLTAFSCNFSSASQLRQATALLRRVLSKPTSTVDSASGGHRELEAAVVVTVNVAYSLAEVGWQRGRVEDGLVTCAMVTNVRGHPRPLCDAEALLLNLPQLSPVGGESRQRGHKVVGMLRWDRNAPLPVGVAFTPPHVE